MDPLAALLRTGGVAGTSVRAGLAARGARVANAFSAALRGRVAATGGLGMLGGRGRDDDASARAARAAASLGRSGDAVDRTSREPRVVDAALRGRVAATGGLSVVGDSLWYRGAFVHGPADDDAEKRRRIDEFDVHVAAVDREVETYGVQWAAGRRADNAERDIVPALVKNYRQSLQARPLRFSKSKLLQLRVANATLVVSVSGGALADSFLDKARAGSLYAQAQLLVFVEANLGCRGTSCVGPLNEKVAFFRDYPRQPVVVSVASDRLKEENLELWSLALKAKKGPAWICVAPGNPAPGDCVLLLEAAKAAGEKPAVRLVRVDARVLDVCGGPENFVKLQTDALACLRSLGLTFAEGLRIRCLSRDMILDEICPLKERLERVFPVASFASYKKPGSIVRSICAVDEVTEYGDVDSYNSAPKRQQHCLVWCRALMHADVRMRRLDAGRFRLTRGYSKAVFEVELRQESLGPLDKRLTQKSLGVYSDNFWLKDRKYSGKGYYNVAYPEP